MCKFVLVTIIGTIVPKPLIFNNYDVFRLHITPVHYERGRLNPRDGSTEQQQQQQVVKSGKQTHWNINKYRSFQDNGLFL